MWKVGGEKEHQSTAQTQCGGSGEPHGAPLVLTLNCRSSSRDPRDCGLELGKEKREERQVTLTCLTDEVPTESNCKS